MTARLGLGAEVALPTAGHGKTSAYENTLHINTLGEVVITRQSDPA